MNTNLSLARYQRQIQFSEFGIAAQQRLLKSRVMICGCGALGTTVANHLVRAGVGFLRLVDRDLVDETNLHRQVLFDEEDARLARPKAVAAAERLRRINSQVVIEPVIADVQPENIARWGGDVNLILDGTDNFETRYLINDFAHQSRIPWISAACLGTQGQLMVIVPGETPCLRCLLPSPPAPGSVPTCDSAGVFGPAVGVVASVQAMEAIKLLAGKRESVTTDLVVINLWPLLIRRIKTDGLRDVPCPVCKEGRYDFLSQSRGTQTTILCGQKTVQITPSEPAQVDFAKLAEQWRSLGQVEETPFFVRISQRDVTLTLFVDGRAIIRGVEDVAAARTLYARLVGL